MSLRLPQDLGSSFTSDRLSDAFNREVLAEKAASLGRAGRKLQMTLSALKDVVADADRALLLHDAADAAHGYFIQRELCGLYAHQSIIEDYDIPKEVLIRMGAR